ncbi:ClpP/crotonase-like domain-containing protein [Ilyonectria robusta]|uniref:ClpP/crotonase-like domain-containing protein n=1 Tax=Ilyonectria robusta TaxID=1079257 RepID=UPI001E8CE6B1|nr:ClpP/crotonase-like domain-containing protein [Ilyonectria robusta]KAH8734773.1 ClpP/crotonase-like domain-containing protein [Ilyonectria robusta]
MASSASSFPDNYNTFSLPTLQFSHHPPSSPTVTPVIIVKLHRPADRNGFTDEMAASIIRAFDTLSADPRVKAVVLTSSDPANRIFCAGMDFNSAHGIGPSRDAHRDSGGQVALAVYRCAKPVIAAINGSAVGVGITMTLPANIRVTSRDAKIGFVFGRRGFNMEACSSFFLPRLVGTSKALHLTTTGAVYPATHHLFDDLFTEVVAPDEVLSTALKIAEESASNVSGVASRVMKDMIYRGPGSPEEAHLLESKIFYDLFKGPDSKEGIDSFLEKRLPDFKATMESDAPSAFPWWTPVDIQKPKSKI